MHVEDKILKLIKEYNSHKNHRKVIIIEDFGEPFLQDTARYFANYKLDSDKEETIGIKQRGEKFYSYGRGQEELTVDQAVSDFERQLSEIPLK